MRARLGTRREAMRVRAVAACGPEDGTFSSPGRRKQMLELRYPRIAKAGKWVVSGARNFTHASAWFCEERGELLLLNKTFTFSQRQGNLGNGEDLNEPN